MLSIHVHVEVEFRSSTSNRRSCIELHDDYALIRHIQTTTCSRKTSLIFKLVLTLAGSGYNHESIGVPIPNSIGGATLIPYRRFSSRHSVHYKKNRLG